MGIALFIQHASVWHYAFRITYEERRRRILPAITFATNTPGVFIFFFFVCFFLLDRSNLERISTQKKKKKRIKSRKDQKKWAAP
jgi:hypothetical protein